MKVLLVNGSPNKAGCTYTALSEVARALNAEGIETEIFHIGNTPISGCKACRACKKTGKCIIDDLVNEFAKKAKEADGFIFGSPVYYAAANGSLVSFMDRLFFSAGKTMRLKPAAAVASARRAGTTATLDIINKYFTICEMPIVSSRYWNMVHGSTPDDVLKDEEGLWTMRTLGRNMAYLLKAIGAAKEAGIPTPKQEQGVFTNFIR